MVLFDIHLVLSSNLLFHRSIVDGINDLLYALLITYYLLSYIKVCRAYVVCRLLPLFFLYLSGNVSDFHGHDSNSVLSLIIQIIL